MAVGSGSQTYSPGLAGLCAMMIENAVRDVRGRKGIDDWGAPRTPHAEQKRRLTKEQRVELARRWLLGTHKGEVSVFDACAMAGVDYERFRRLLIQHGDIPNQNEED